MSHPVNDRLYDSFIDEWQDHLERNKLPLDTKPTEDDFYNWREFNGYVAPRDLVRGTSNNHD